MRRFMIRQTYKSDLNLFLKQAKLPTEGTKGAIAQDKLPMNVVIPAYIISELKTAFLLGFFIYVPFLIIDMVVANILQAMGMFMLSPTIISLPFKLLLFVLINGWELLIKNLVLGYV